MPRTVLLRTPMAPITITANRLHLHNFRRWEPRGCDSKYVLADLLICNGLHIDQIAFILDNQGNLGFFQHWQWTRPQVEGSHLWQIGHPEVTDPLSEFLARAIFKWVFIANKKAMLAYLRGQSEHLELPVFYPWEGKSIQIPITGIQAFSFEYHSPDLREPSTQRNGKVRCQLTLDRHLYFYNVPIYSRNGWEFHEDGIRNPAINQAIKTLLHHQGLRKYVRQTFTSGSTVDFDEHSFVFASQGFHPEGPPSPITLV